MIIIHCCNPGRNRGDASRRLIHTLSTITVVAAGDTRVTVHLCKALAIENRPKLIALHDHNERGKAVELVGPARDIDFLVLSDAGMPSVSDPAFHLVDAAAAASVQVTAVPDPSAVLAALAVSGLLTDRFTFEGFLLRKHGERVKLMRDLAVGHRTMVFFELPNRLADSLLDLAATFGNDRRVVACRELTKFCEEVKRGTASELAE